MLQQWSLSSREGTSYALDGPGILHLKGFLVLLLRKVLSLKYPWAGLECQAAFFSTFIINPSNPISLPASKVTKKKENKRLKINPLLRKAYSKHADIPRMLSSLIALPTLWDSIKCVSC